MFKKYLNKFSSDNEGTFATTFAVLLVPMLLSVGVAIDYSNMVRLQSKAQFTADSAILAAAIAVRDGGLIDGNTDSIIKNQPEIEKLLKAEFHKYYDANNKSDSNFKLENISVNYDPNERESIAQISFAYKPYIMGKLKSDDTLRLNVNTSVMVDVETGGAVSIFLVLDKSGSMGWQDKMATLKEGVEAMASQFETSDPDHEYVRMGSIAYDSWPSVTQPLEWGTNKANNFVQSLSARGGTDSFKAMNTARIELHNPIEVKEHQDKNGQDPKKYLVFMTDGSNNTSQSDRKTKRVCDNAKRDEIEVFTVAFKAPLRGQQLLKYCATSNDHYYNADNNAKLLEAFQQIGASVSTEVAISK